MIVWQETGRYKQAVFGHLFAYIEDLDHEPGEPAPVFNWFIAPDDEDKNYRRALRDGSAETFEGAVAAIELALRDITDALIISLEGFNDAETKPE